MFPDFLCIGAQKAGTTWLYENLRRQPGIWLPPVKELHFLDHPSPSLLKRLFSKSSHHRTPRRHLTSSLSKFLFGQGSRESLARAWHISLLRRDFDWYEKIFPRNNGLVCGEICPGYASLRPEIISEIIRRNPDIRIIYMLRYPVDRAWSSLSMHFRKPRKQVSAHDLGKIAGRLASQKFLKHCAYKQNLENWSRHVPATNMYIGWFDRISTEPDVLLTEILRFLGVSTELTSDAVTTAVNAGAGEKIDPVLEENLAKQLRAEVTAVHERFSNCYTSQWLARIEGVLGVT